MMNFFRDTALCGSMFFCLTAASEPPKKPAAVAVVKKAPIDVKQIASAMQKHYNSISTATFKFEQSYIHPFLAQRESSKGVVTYDKSGAKILWDYLEPKDKQKKFIINKNKFVYYSVCEKIAYTHDCYEQDTLSASMAFLMGKGDLAESFTIKPANDQTLNQALSWISLTPKESGGPAAQIFMGVDRRHNVVETVVEDATRGKNHFKFIDLTLNKKIEASIFDFKPPKGVTVQPMPNVQCKKPAATKPPAPTTKANAEKKPAAK